MKERYSSPDQFQTVILWCWVRFMITSTYQRALWQCPVWHKPSWMRPAEGALRSLNDEIVSSFSKAISSYRHLVRWNQDWPWSTGQPHWQFRSILLHHSAPVRYNCVLALHNNLWKDSSPLGTLLCTFLDCRGLVLGSSCAPFPFLSDWPWIWT